MYKAELEYLKKQLLLWWKVDEQMKSRPIHAC